MQSKRENFKLEEAPGCLERNLPIPFTQVNGGQIFRLPKAVNQLIDARCWVTIKLGHGIKITEINTEYFFDTSTTGWHHSLFDGSMIPRDSI